MLIIEKYKLLEDIARISVNVNPMLKSHAHIRSSDQLIRKEQGNGCLFIC